MAVGEAFTRWLAQHPKGSSADNYVVKLTILTASSRTGSSDPWMAGPPAIMCEVIGYDELGILVRKTSSSDSEVTFYPWSSIHEMK